MNDNSKLSLAAFAWVRSANGRDYLDVATISQSWEWSDILATRAEKAAGDAWARDNKRVRRVEVHVSAVTPAIVGGGSGRVIGNI